MRKRSPVTIANEEVSIITACQLIGMDIGDDYATSRSMKLHCPFTDVYHSSLDRAFRVYPDSNHAYCFSCKMYFSPVSLIATAWDLDRKTAAVELLERTGYRPPTVAATWDAVTAAGYEPPDATMLTEALKTYCRRVHPHWETCQFDRHVAVTFTRCLSLLDQVRSDADADLWLTGCKTVMSRALTSTVVSEATS